VLEAYAARHEGAFPAGESSPEASLSLLYTNVDGVTPELLRGKTVPEPLVRQILSRGCLLGPDSCGWHYVEGLRTDDNPHLAIFWDKVGLDHAGQRLSKGGHVVMLLDKNRKYVPAREWDTFLEEQRKFWADRTNGTELAISATTRIAGDEVQLQLRVLDGYLYGRVWRRGRMSSGRTLAHMERQPETGIVGLPVLTATELKSAKVEVGSVSGRVRFTMRNHQILYDGKDFTFESLRDSAAPEAGATVREK
jgi:hypothetical protein